MTHRENILAILRYQPFEQLPIVSFGYWNETLDRWATQGHISPELAQGYRKEGDNSSADMEIMRRLGFDFNWNSCFGFAADLFPRFTPQVLETFPDGSRILRDSSGLICKDKPGTVSIPAEIGTCLEDRAAWNALYLPKMQYTPQRINFQALEQLPPPEARSIPLGLHCGSLIGTMRNLLGVEQLSYLLADDEDLYLEIAQSFADLSYRCSKAILETGACFDYAHYWEDICFKNGPLVSPTVFDQVIGPHYRRNNELLRAHGIDIISVDCDGLIDRLIPTWLNNGVNTMFPIEVGTWGASIANWRKAYGRELRGVGGMNKTVFAADYAAIDEEIARLQPLIALGGYIPCPDHRIAPDAKWENVQYYCERLREVTR